MSTIYDLLIIGGGINGVGIAADAAGRGLNVYLCEQDDLASHTSSASSKMIHGGLRYLEYYEFRLVREALKEREVLLNVAPHLVQPLRLVIPHNKLQRPAWIIRIGLFLYDILGKRWRIKSSLQPSRGINLYPDEAFGKPLKPELNQAFAYSDCRVDDARLVVLNAMVAAQRGASINTRTELLHAERRNGIWHATLKNKLTNDIIEVQAKALVNAAGPWVDMIIRDKLHLQTKHHVELVKGSHIVLPKMYEGEHAYLLQNEDKRVVFAIPYHDNFTMIGTTDIPYFDDPAKVEIGHDEVGYLCDIVNHYFQKQIHPSDVVSSWSGVRPLQAEEKENPSAVTRDYVLEVEDSAGTAPILSIFGGKITTYRRLAEHAMSKLRPYFPHLPSAWTAKQPLPGGDMPDADLEQFTLNLQMQYLWLPKELAVRYAHSYGTLCELFLQNKTSLADLGQDFGAGFYGAELRYLIDHEWAQNVEDIIWRRTKLGLKLTAAEIEKLALFII